MIVNILYTIFTIFFIVLIGAFFYFLGSILMLFVELACTLIDPEYPRKQEQAKNDKRRFSIFRNKHKR